MDSQRETLEGLLEIGRLLSSKLDLDDLLRTILETASRVVGSQSASLLLLDDASGELYFHTALGLGDAAAATRLKIGQGIAGCVAKNRKSEIIPDVKADARWSPAMDARSGFGTRSILAVPLLIQGRLLGVLEAINKTTGAFSDEDMRRFETFAAQAGAAVENARLFSALKEEKSKLDLVFSEMTDGVILCGADGRILLANPAAHGLLGLASASAFLADAWAGFSLSQPLKSLLSARENLPFEAHREKPKLLIIAGTAGALAPGRAGGGAKLWIFRDETEARQKDRLKHTFLSLIAHKLRTPLTAVIGYSELVLHDLENQNSGASLKKPLEAILIQGRKLADLVERLIRYAVLESPEDAPRAHAPCSLDAVVSKALDEMAQKLSAAGTKASYQKPAKDARFFGNQEQLIEAAKNLLDNAAKFNDKTDKSVDVKVEARPGWAALIVSDNGPGIPPEEGQRIFSRFHQVEASFTGQVDGWGLGLPFVKKVAELHGGKVELESRLGKGTRVSVLLPALEAPKP